MDSLGDIRKKFPNAKFKQVKAAWVMDDEDFYSMEGHGFPGTLYLAFRDLRPTFRKMASAPPEKAEPSDEPIAQNKFFLELAERPDDVALTVKWVRWSPAEPIPLRRYKTKFGPPSRCDFDVATMQPYCEWTSRALRAYLTDDQESVLFVESSFTAKELQAAQRRREAAFPGGASSETDDEGWEDLTPAKPGKPTRGKAKPKNTK